MRDYKHCDFLLCELGAKDFLNGLTVQTLHQDCIKLVRQTLL